MKVLSGILQLINPEAFGRAARVTRYVNKIAQAMEVADLWQIETAAYLSQIGCVILPEEALKKLYAGQTLTGEEAQLFAMHPSIGSDLLSSIPRMETVAKIIANQENSFDTEDSNGDEEVMLGSRILKTVLDFDRIHANDIPDGDAIAIMKSRAGRYDPKVLAALQTVLGVDTSCEKMELSLGELKDGMILDGDIFLKNGRLLAAKGYQVNLTLRERMKNFVPRPGITEPIQVLVPSAMVKKLSRNTH